VIYLADKAATLGPGEDNMKVWAGSELDSPVGAAAGVAGAALVTLEYGLVLRALQQSPQLVVPPVFHLDIHSLGT
jgi:hypothetical protein